MQLMEDAASFRTLKAYNIDEIDNQASIRLKHEEINTASQMSIHINITFGVWGRP